MKRRRVPVATDAASEGLNLHRTAPLRAPVPIPTGLVEGREPAPRGVTRNYFFRHLFLSVSVSYTTGEMSNDGDRLAIDELCALVNLPRRTVRYYIQEGLVDRPVGAKRGAYYTRRHVEQLMAIRTWQRAGLNLERIRELVAEGDGRSPLPPPRRPRRGDVTLRTHVTLGPGVELVIDPQEAGLSAAVVRALARRAAALIDELRKEED